MEIIPEGKNFRLVPEDELPKLLQLLENYFPHSLKFHQTIKTFLNDRVWDFHFYVAKNFPEEPVCLHFPGCTLTPNNNIYESFGIFCPLDQLDHVELVQTEDVLIDWKIPMYLNYTHIDIIERLDNFLSTIGTVEKISGDVWICDGSLDQIELDILPSDEVEMRQLCSSNVQAIHDLYPAHEIESVEVFEKLADQLPGMGVFTVDGLLAAWMVQSYYGAMFSMQTRKEYRRKGYGIHLARDLGKMVLSRGYKPFVIIRSENEASKSLYRKLGFEKKFESARIVYEPYGDENTIAPKMDDKIKTGNGSIKLGNGGTHMNGNHGHVKCMHEEKSHL